MLPITTQSLALLTSQEQRALAAYKHRYHLASAGFTPAEAQALCFLRWLHSVARI
jgi:hypothetical protein